MKFHNKERYILALWSIVVSVLMSLMLGGLFSLIAGDFWSCTQGMFLYFGAPGVAAGRLLLLTPIDDSLAWGFGCGLYYGTMFVYAYKIVPFVCKFILWLTTLLSAFLSTALVCYIVYRKYFR